MYPEAKDIQSLVNQSNSIVIIQPDNPDGDSLGSALALEQIFAALNKETFLVCGTTMPSYLKYLSGWDRIETNLPTKYDLAVLVDTSAASLIENLTKHTGLSSLNSKPLIVIDHHASDSSIDFAKVRLNIASAAATAEVIYELMKQLNWSISRLGLDALAAAILSDTLGLTTDSATARTVHIIGELVEQGVSLSALETARRDTARKSPELVRYKGRLLERIEYFDNDRVALLTIPWEEIERYSPEYNPAMLALDDMRLTTNTAIAVVLKIYRDGKITGKIRTNFGLPVALKLAEAFGGGGHEYASGFKLTNQPDLAKLKIDIVTKAKELLG